MKTGKIIMMGEQAHTEADNKEDEEDVRKAFTRGKAFDTRRNVTNHQKKEDTYLRKAIGRIDPQNDENDKVVTEDKNRRDTIQTQKIRLTIRTAQRTD